MDQIKQLLSRRQIDKPTNGATSERAEPIGYFADEINKERKGTKWPKVTYRYIGVKLAHLSVFDLYAFKRQLEDYQSRGKSFSMGFFGALKVRH
jgi:hypothetical protein